MKNTISFILLLSMISLSCAAQKKISSLNNNSLVMANKIEYAVKKSQNKATIENVKNKFNNVKPYSPNLPNNLNLFPYYVKKDVDLLTKICSTHISLKDLEILSKVKFAGIFIDMRADLEGKILDVSFFIDDNSILTLNQLEEMENEIKNSKIITISPEAKAFTKGSNFLLFYNNVTFESMLKVKRAMR